MAEKHQHIHKINHNKKKDYIPGIEKYMSLNVARLSPVQCAVN